MIRQDNIEDALHPDKPESGYNDHGRPHGKTVRLSWWKRLWNWFKGLFR